MHATTHNVYQYQGMNREDSAASVPVQTKVRQRALPNTENFVAPELHIGPKEIKTTRSVSDVPLTEHQPPNKCIIEDESIVWILLRLLQVREDSEEDDTGVEPLTWNHFCEVMVNESKSPTTVGYGPMYPQPPTNAGVVQASVDYFMSLTNYLCQETTVITGDQPVYQILINIKRNIQKNMERVVRLGGFHVAVNFMGAVGCLMKGSGIEELLVESSACKKGTAEKVLNGKDYYKMLRVHLLLSEAITGLLWKEFEQWLAS